MLSLRVFRIVTLVRDDRKERVVAVHLERRTPRGAVMCVKRGRPEVLGADDWRSPGGGVKAICKGEQARSPWRCSRIGCKGPNGGRWEPPRECQIARAVNTTALDAVVTVGRGPSHPCNIENVSLKADSLGAVEIKHRVAFGKEWGEDAHEGRGQRPLCPSRDAVEQESARRPSFAVRCTEELRPVEVVGPVDLRALKAGRDVAD